VKIQLQSSLIQLLLVTNTITELPNSISNKYNCRAL